MTWALGIVCIVESAALFALAVEVFRQRTISESAREKAEFYLERLRETEARMGGLLDIYGASPQTDTLPAPKMTEVIGQWVKSASEEDEGEETLRPYGAEELASTLAKQVGDTDDLEEMNREFELIDTGITSLRDRRI